MVANISRGLG